MGLCLGTSRACHGSMPVGVWIRPRSFSICFQKSKWAGLFSGHGIIQQGFDCLMGSAWVALAGQHVIGISLVGFLGGYIDRWPEIRETLQIVQGMADAGQAVATRGNHEFNALAYNTPDGQGGWLRPHNSEKTAQHRATLEQFADYQDEWLDWLDWLEWFLTLPLFLRGQRGATDRLSVGWRNPSRCTEICAS